jgi:hypothetical protein
VTEQEVADAGPGLLARKTWRTLEPLHSMIYFVPEAADAYARLGVAGPAGYFGSRAAAMGAVTAEVVVSTFFNFNPVLVHEAIPAAWERASPEALVAARFDAVDAAFHRVLGDEILSSDEMRRAAELARFAAEVAGRHGEGRPLAAAHAEVAWPSAPHLVLWHAQSILREYRGDGHIAQLVRSTRAWPDDAWDRAVDSLRARGWLERDEELRFTDAGAAERQALEDGTDALAAAPYTALGAARCEELRALARPWSVTMAQQLP